MPNNLRRLATLTIEMPSSCDRCRLHHVVYGLSGNMLYCRVITQNYFTEDTDKRPNWCPLVPVREPDITITMNTVDCPPEYSDVLIKNAEEILA